MLLMAAGLALAGSVLTAVRARVVLRGVVVQGRVVGHERRDLDDAVSFHPIIEFDDPVSGLRRFTSRSGSGEPQPPAGSDLEVCCLPGEPEAAYIRSFLHLWAAPVAMFAGAALLLAAAMKA